jgi:two-component system, OmpR family, osmolarity sensor histidine kinase EnvZ
MRLLPKSLFLRLVLLISLAVMVVVVTLALIFRQDRATLVARNFTDAKLQQIESLRDALAKAPDDRALTVQMIARPFGTLIVPVDRRPDIGRLPGPAFKQIVTRLKEQLGEQTEIRWGTRLDQAIVWIRFPVATASVKPGEKSRDVWVGFPLRNIDAGELPIRLAIVLGGVTLALLLGTFWFTRRLTRPLSDLSRAVEIVAEGRRPEPLPEDGPSEIAAVSRNVNKMAANLEQLETDRKTMLAGISHDIRTPLSRLRLATEISVADRAARSHMAADIDEIDRIVTQFLDFARGEPKESPTQMRVDEALNHIAEKAAANSHAVEWIADANNAAHASEIRLYPAAFERMLLNLIENAHRYGKPPVQLTAALVDGRIEIAVIDHGEGVASADVDRLKQPFVRGDIARGGAMGAGLGLAIVDRLARWHDGTFTIGRRAGGGNAATIVLPVASPHSSGFP